MNYRIYCGVSATIYGVVALAHLTRLFSGWSVEIDAMTVPMLASWKVLNLQKRYIPPHT